MTIRSFVEMPLNRLAQIALLQQRRRRRRVQPVRAAVLAGARLSRGAALTGATNSRRGIFSAWVRTGPSAATKMMLSDALANTRFHVSSTNRLFVNLDDDTGATVVALTVGPLIDELRWRHVLCAWDTEQAQAADRFRLVLDGAEQVVSPTIVQGVDIDYAGPTNWHVGHSGGANPLNGALAQLVFAPGEWLDLTDADNVEIFIRAGRPIPRLNLPFTPAILMDSGRVDPIRFAANQGDGGAFSVTDGALRRHDGPPIRVGA